MAIIRGTNATVPVFTVSAITTRKDPIYRQPSPGAAGRTVGARPIAERCVYSVTGAAVSGNCRFLAASSVLYRVAVISIRKTYSGRLNAS